MQKLQKINSRLEKNAEDWKLKHYNCQQQLILLTESNLKQTEKNQKLEKLCRALQVKIQEFIEKSPLGNIVTKFTWKHDYKIRNTNLLGNVNINFETSILPLNLRFEPGNIAFNLETSL